MAHVMLSMSVPHCLKHDHFWFASTVEHGCTKFEHDLKIVQRVNNDVSYFANISAKRNGYVPLVELFAFVGGMIKEGQILNVL